MRFVRFRDPAGSTRIGIAPDSEVMPGAEVQLVGGTLLGRWFVRRETSQISQLLTPFVPTEIHGAGLNYRAAFSGSATAAPPFPVLFIKPLSTLQNPGAPIILPRLRIRVERAKLEGELCVILSRQARNVRATEAMDYVLGYTVANDVSASDWQGERSRMQWTKGKAFDTFCPLGPVLVTADEIPDPRALRVISTVDGVTVQDDSVGSMVFSVAELIAFLSAGQTIPAGAAILTGTPVGTRYLEPGETVRISINRIGTLVSPVTEEGS